MGSVSSLGGYIEKVFQVAIRSGLQCQVQIHHFKEIIWVLVTGSNAIGVVRLRWILHMILYAALFYDKHPGKCGMLMTHARKFSQNAALLKVNRF